MSQRTEPGFSVATSSRPGNAPGLTGPMRFAQPLPGRADVLKPGTMAVYAMLLVLLAGTFALGLKGVGAIRPVFVVASLFVAWRAWKVSPGLHTEVLIFLFTLAPFLRRVVDFAAGYDATGFMLLAPMLALTLPIGELRKMFTTKRQDFGIYAPYILILICATYGWAYASFQDRMLPAGIEAVKMLMPVLYAMYLIQRNDGCVDIVQGFGRAFMIVGPCIGIYGVAQWLNPLEWDRFWMIASHMGAVGYPEPREIRVFSTMNSPASFANFAVCGLLILSYCRRGWLPFLLVVPIGMGLLLASVRTTWMATALAIAFAFAFASTRQRSIVLSISLVGAIAAAFLLTPAGDVISSRFATMGSAPSQDFSAQERLVQIEYVYSNLDQYLFGNGFGNFTKLGKLANIDGQFISSAVTMGIVVGNIHVLCIIWAGVQGLLKIKLRDNPLRVITGAMLFGYLIFLPLQAVAIGEISFLFWLLVGVMTSGSAATARMGSAAAGRPGRAPVLGLTIGH